jgi:hypothetical protein
MPTAKLTGEECSEKCRVKSPESRVQSRSTLRTPHFIVLGIWSGFGISGYELSRYSATGRFGKKIWNARRAIMEFGLPVTGPPFAIWKKQSQVEPTVSKFIETLVAELKSP